MHRRMPRAPGLPFGGGLNLLLVAGAAYFVWEHGQAGMDGRRRCARCAGWTSSPRPPGRPVAPVRPGRQDRPDRHASQVLPLAALTASR
jgi:hypothetical protein